MMAAERQGLRVRKLAGDGPIHTDPRDGVPAKYGLAGVVFIDKIHGRRTDEVPEAIRVPTDYASREPWIELVNSRAVTKPAGPPSNPWAGQPPHVFLHADELVLHMQSGDYRYKVVHQPDKYDASGKPTDVTGDPTTTVDWFYDADLIKE
jgi:hypothetical protein